MGFAEYLFSFILCFVDVKESLVGVGLVSYDNKFKIAQLEKGIVDAFQPCSKSCKTTIFVLCSWQ